MLRPGKTNLPASTVRDTVMQTRKDLSGPCTLSYRVTNKGYWRREVRVQIVGDDLMCRATNKQCKSGHWVWQSASSDLPYLILISPSLLSFLCWPVLSFVHDCHGRQGAGCFGVRGNNRKPSPSAYIAVNDLRLSHYRSSQLSFSALISPSYFVGIPP